MNEQLSTPYGHDHDVVSKACFDETETALDILYDQIKYGDIQLHDIKNALMGRITLHTKDMESASLLMETSESTLLGKQGFLNELFNEAGHPKSRQSGHFIDAIDILCTAIANRKTNWKAIEGKLFLFAMDDQENLYRASRVFGWRSPVPYRKLNAIKQYMDELPSILTAPPVSKKSKTVSANHNDIQSALDKLYDQIKYQGVNLQNVRDALTERIMLYTRKSKAASDSLGLSDNPLRRKRSEIIYCFRKAGEHTQRQADAYGDTIDTLCIAVVGGQMNWTSIKQKLTSFAMDDHETVEEAYATLNTGGVINIKPELDSPAALPEKPEIEDHTAYAMGVLFDGMRSPENNLGFRDIKNSIVARMIDRIGHSKAARTLDMGRSTMYRIQQGNAELLKSASGMPQQSDRYALAIDILCDALETKATTLKNIEQETMEFMLDHARTKTDCASILRMGRSTFYRKMQTLSLG